jgi:hypothetical protein
VKPKISRFLIAGLFYLLAMCTAIAAPRKIEYSTYILPTAPVTLLPTNLKAEYKHCAGVPSGGADIGGHKDKVNIRDPKTQSPQKR